MRLARHGKVRYVVVGFGWQGVVGRGPVRFGMVRLVRHGLVRQGLVGQVKVWLVWFGQVCSGKARQG